ncbi:MAG: DUF2784 domain-containing protein [Pseudomonadales bacterium]|nr:DUF2784 domain-containing protein [Pseudomonadales bacterium]
MLRQLRVIARRKSGTLPVIQQKANMMSTAYLLLANIAAALHFSFVAFVIAGGLLCYRWPRLVWLHFPVAVYGITIMVVNWRCPLTDLEIWLRKMAGQQVNWTEFIEHYIWSAVGWDGTEPFILALIVLLIVLFNFKAYRDLVKEALSK